MARDAGGPGAAATRPDGIANRADHMVSPARSPVFQQPALMFAVKSADVRDRFGEVAGVETWCLQREAGPKTTVKQALMRGLDTA